MEINGKNVLLLEKRGGNFGANEPMRQLSDIGNYRVCTPWASIPGKDGRKYYAEFTAVRDRKQMRRTNKRTGAPLAHPVFDIINPAGMYCATSYTDNDGTTWGNSAQDAAIWAHNYSYTVADLLTVVNEICSAHYSGVKWVQALKMSTEPGENFTPAGLILRYAGWYGLETRTTPDGVKIRLPLGWYKYLCYNVTPGGDCDSVSVVLEEVS